MLLRRFTDFILQGRLQAMAVVFIAAFLPVVGSISIIIVALVTLRKGIIDGALVLLAATFPYLLGYATYPASGRTDLVMGVMALGVISNLLTWLFALMLRRFSNWGFTLELAGLLGVIGVVVLHLIFPGIEKWWLTELTTYFSKTASMAAGQETDAMLQAAEAGAVDYIKPYATGLLLVGVLLNVMMQLVMARWWQAFLFNPGGLRKELYSIRLGYIAAAMFIMGTVLGYFGNATALDAMPILYGVFCVAGLSMSHALLAAVKNGWILLVLIYLGVVWLFPYGVVAIAFVALFDTLLDFRKRLRKSVDH